MNTHSNQPELSPIADLCSGKVCYMAENGLRYIYMEKLRFHAKSESREMDALLCLNYTNPSYPTKMYLSANIGLGLNWNETAYILARPWFSWSWANVPPTLRPIEILANHLKALQ